MEKEEFLRLLPKLIREDDEVKGAIISALSGVMSTKSDIEKIIEHSDKRFEELLKHINTGFEQSKREQHHLSNKIDEINVTIGSLGRRSGTNLEESIRNLLNDKLIRENINISKIHKEYLIDEEGIIFPKRYSTDIDVIVENGNTILMEIKYCPDNQDIFHFLKVAELYKLKQKTYDYLVLLGLEMKENHIEFAKQQGIKIIIGKIIV